MTTKQFYRHTGTGSLYAIELSRDGHIVASAGPLEKPLQAVKSYQYNTELNEWLESQSDKLMAVNFWGKAFVNPSNGGMSLKMAKTNQTKKYQRDILLHGLRSVLKGTLDFLSGDQKRIVTKYNDKGRPIQTTPRIVIYGPNPLSDNVYRMTRDTLTRIYLSNSDVKDPPPTESSDPTAGLQNLAIYTQQQIVKIMNPTPKDKAPAGGLRKPTLSEMKAEGLDNIDSFIIIQYQDAEQEHKKYPTDEEIAKRLYKRKITNTTYARQAINTRVLKLRKMDLIGQKKPLPTTNIID